MLRKYYKISNNNKTVTTLDYKVFLYVAYLNPTDGKPNQIMMLSKWTTLYRKKENSLIRLNISILLFSNFII